MGLFHSLVAMFEGKKAILIAVRSSVQIKVCIFDDFSKWNKEYVCVFQCPSTGCRTAECVFSSVFCIEDSCLEWQWQKQRQSERNRATNIKTSNHISPFGIMHTIIYYWIRVSLCRCMCVCVSAPGSHGLEFACNARMNPSINTEKY